LGKEELLIHISRVLNIKVRSSLMFMEDSDLLYAWIMKDVFL
jgi:hypothetical protein